MSGKEATQAISRLGRLKWTLTTTQEANVPPQSSGPLPGVTSGRPRRTIDRLGPAQLQRLSRVHRGVFALADGTKNTAKIAEVLSTPPHIVEQAIRDLYNMGIITFV